MSDTAVSRAMARREKLQEEIRQIDLFLSLYQRFSNENGDAPSTASPPLSSVGKPRGALSNSKSFGMSQVEFEKILSEVLRENGRPMEKEAILAKFHAMGRRLGGDKEMNNLKSKLWRATQGDFVRIPGAGLWIANLPCPAVNYVPPESTA
jgi:hypothetical protein